MQLSSVCLTHVACGATACSDLTSTRSSPKRKLNWWKVHFLSFLFCLDCLSCVRVSCFLLVSVFLAMPAFSKVLSGLWDVNEGDKVVNPRQFYNVFTEAVPYFNGYRWGYGFVLWGGVLFRLSSRLTTFLPLMCKLLNSFSCSTCTDFWFLWRTSC